MLSLLLVNINILLKNFIILLNINNILLLSETCNGPNYNQCLSCTSPSHLYNNICCCNSYYNKNIILLVIIKIYLTIFLFLSETCYGIYSNNCLSCTSPSHLYNNICCDYSWQIPKIYNKKYLFFF